jgi:hypothetical protein
MSGEGAVPDSPGRAVSLTLTHRKKAGSSFGGAWLTPQILSDEALRTFQSSIQRFKEATRKATVDVLLQNHMLMDPIQPKVDAFARRRAAETNPFVVGRDGYQTFLGVMEGCTTVNLARRQGR